MAIVVWTTQAKTVRRELYRNGLLEFGQTVAKRTARIIEGIADDLSRWPTAGFPEPLLKGAPHLYRSRHINKRFKMVYRYDEQNDIVYIEDIWDTRRAPQNLMKRVK